MQFSIRIIIRTFVRVKKLIWIYSDIHSCNFVDTNIFGHSFVSKFSRMSHSAAWMGSCSTQLWSHRPLSISLPWKMRRYVVRPSLFVRKTLRKTGLCGKIWKTETQHFLQSQLMTRVMELDRKPPLCAFPQHPLKALRRDLTTKSLPTFRRQHHSIVRLKTASQMHVAPGIVWSLTSGQPCGTDEDCHCHWLA